MDHEEQEESGKNFQKNIHSIYGADDPEGEKEEDEEDKGEDSNGNSNNSENK